MALDSSAECTACIHGCLLAQANVFVVGDPDQAIYGWRGANVVNMSRSFDVDYPGDADVSLFSPQ